MSEFFLTYGFVCSLIVTGYLVYRAVIVGGGAIIQHFDDVRVAKENVPAYQAHIRELEAEVARLREERKAGPYRGAAPAPERHVDPRSN